MEIYIDIGTTTVAASNSDGNALSLPNPQRTFGYDVVTRLEAAAKYGVCAVRRPLIDCINDIIYTLSGNYDSVSFVSVSANTAMSCFFTGVDPGSLAAFPYTVPDYFGRTFAASSLGLRCENADVFVSRCLSAYCGGDVLSGIIASDLDKTDRAYIYVDIGTNGEMAAGLGKRTIYASAAAGPALEGGNVSCGASGIDGAINRIFAIETIDKTVRLKEYGTIGNACKCTGLCGSALIDLLALLKKDGAIDEFGVLCNTVELPDGLTFTQDDVCALQLAKSAVRSGIDCLLEAVFKGGEPDDVYIAGIMGAKINMDSACEIGLFPSSFKGKTRLAGNMALKGAESMKKAENRLRAEAFAKKSKKLSLSGNRRFETLFEENILL